MPAVSTTRVKCPRATYRLQFNERFRLADALALVPYLAGLGISHIYASPLFKAAAHSVHGYDVCDFSRLNPELGTEADLEKLADALHEHGMGLVIDIVPNHMGVATAENRWWWDVLENGRDSRFANHFDINWEPADETLRDKVLVPVLGDELSRILANDELQLEKAGSELCVRYHEHRFPVARGSVRPESALRELLGRQHYVLAPYWEGDERLNYRRFFAVNTLAAIRVEDENVFKEVHALIGKWIARGWIDGLRVDHPDGLRDPKKYLERLRALGPDLWIVVEKILQPEEEVPVDWPVQGTVGYDFLNQVNGLFIESKNQKTLVDFYATFTGEPTDAGVAVQEKKTLILRTLFTTEVNRLVGMLTEIASHHPACSKVPAEQWREALIEFAASFPVYRTYVRPHDGFIGESDFTYITEAAKKARGLRPDLPVAMFEFLSGLMLLLFRGEREDEFVRRFQQLTSPAMAKGVEDTAFYCLNWFASINEVGGDPGKFGVSVQDFHAFFKKQSDRWPASMLCSSTHDTKRSEDVRARMNVLSTIPDRWIEAVQRWSAMNERHRRGGFPDRNMEYLYYQTLVGAWPLPFDRIYAYMEKASCEAKQHTDWNHRNNEYDTALKQFVEATLNDREFVRDLETFIGSIIVAAQAGSLAQTLVKLTAPGGPDIYQGNEAWDFSLVDPDNRRPVDFVMCRRLLKEAKDATAEAAWAGRDEGLAKLWLIQRTLALRERKEQAFNGSYEPLPISGDNADNVVAFVRGGDVITIVPRFPLTLTLSHSMGEGDLGLRLPIGQWQNVFTEEEFSGDVSIAKLFQKFPVALLARKEAA